MSEPEFETKLPEIIEKSKFKASKKLEGPIKNDFALPIYIQRRKDMGITITCPDMNITRHLPLPHQYEKPSAFYQDLSLTIAEVDRLAIDEFIRRDFETKGDHRKRMYPRGLKEHLDTDLQALRFKPPQAALLTTKSTRTWQRWCKQRAVKRRSNGLKFDRRHYLIPFSQVEPFLKKQFIDTPHLIFNYVT